MRAGYLMHRFSHRLFGSEMPPVSYTTDGAELGKVMVAEGLGVTVLPDYSVSGDPMERAGLITPRPIAGDRTAITLVLRSRPRRTRAASRCGTCARRWSRTPGPTAGEPARGSPASQGA